MKRRRVKQKSAPWMNADIKSLMIERDNCKKNASSDWNRYKQLRNRVTLLIRTCKRKYITENILNNKGNSLEVWKLLHTLLPKKKGNVLKHVKYEGKEIHDNKDIAEVMNNSFVDAPKRLKANLRKE